jgi:hypothetical protein
MDSNLNTEKLQSLNLKRRNLIKEVRELQKKQEVNLSRMHVEVAVDLEDVADSFFTFKIEKNGKSLSQRLENCIKFMV